MGKIRYTCMWSLPHLHSYMTAKYKQGKLIIYNILHSTNNTSSYTYSIINDRQRNFLNSDDIEFAVEFIDK